MATNYKVSWRRGRRESEEWESGFRRFPYRGCNDHRAPFSLVNGRCGSGSGRRTGYRSWRKSGGSGASSPGCEPSRGKVPRAPSLILWRGIARAGLPAGQSAALAACDGVA
eukprot:scaffold118750_cov32-Tisochrysis_lutea.AAC.1